jgi:hypothetical protein
MTARRPGLLFIAACVAALALRLILPAGWMPVAGNDGVVISLCSGQAADDPAVPGSGGDGPCDYALALGPLLMAAALVLPLLALPLVPAPVPMAVVPALRRRWPRPPGQGPPTA